MRKQYSFEIEPIAKPRMTQSDKWRKRPCVIRYRAYCDDLRQQAKTQKFLQPDSDYWIVFYIPMPKSWSGKKKTLMNGTPHRGKPDKDNLEKAFLDALCKDDSYIWDGRVSKRWGVGGLIVVTTGG